MAEQRQRQRKPAEILRKRPRLPESRQSGPGENHGQWGFPPSPAPQSQSGYESTHRDEADSDLHAVSSREHTVKLSGRSSATTGKIIAPPGG